MAGLGRRINTRSIDTYDNPNTPENESEIVQENHYYPFGLNHEGPWYGGIGPENKYQYNGKELNEDFGLNWYDFGARWQDPAIGRLSGVDSLAGDFPSWSSYSYTFNNPIRFIDPDGRAPDDIVLQGTRTEQRRLLGRLQALTNDKLGIVPETGEVFVSKVGSENADRNLVEGSDLIRSLINDDNTVNIRVTIQGTGTNPLDESGNIIPADQVQSGTEYDSKIGFELGRPVNTANVDGTRGGVPDFVSMAHELGHAKSNAEGTNDRTEFQLFDFDTQQVRPVTTEEFNSRVNENKIRQEQRLIQRALPIPLIFKF